MNMRTSLKAGDVVRILDAGEIDYIEDFFETGDEVEVLRVESNTFFDTVQLKTGIDGDEVGFTVTPNEFHALELVKEAAK